MRADDKATDLPPRKGAAGQWPCLLDCLRAYLSALSPLGPFDRLGEDLV